MSSQEQMWINVSVKWRCLLLNTETFLLFDDVDSYLFLCLKEDASFSIDVFITN